MKLTAIIFILVTALQTSGMGGYAQKERITLSVKDAPLTEVFGEIEKQTGYTFTYSPEDLKNTKPVSIRVKNATLDNVLTQCFKGQPVTYVILDQSISIRCLHKTKMDEVQEPPKPEPVTGTVKGKDGELMQGVTVSRPKPYKTTTTNEKGEFQIDIPDNSSTLMFSFVNYDVQSVPVVRGKHIVVQLNVAEKGLDEVIIIPYSHTTPRLTTGSVFKVTAADIAKQPVNDPLASLVGSVPGLLVTQNTGLPGSRFSVQIRGQNSIGLSTTNTTSGDPFFLINGIPFAPNNQFQPTIATGNAHGSRGRSPFSSINPGDLESIEILKDADATAIYGSRAANGAVIMTTKKGKAGKPSYAFDVKTGFGYIIRQVPMLNTQQYVAMRKDALANDNLPVNPMFAPDIASWDTNRYTNFQDMLVGGSASTTTLQASASGGTENTQYLLSATHHYETTVFPGKLAYNRTSMHGQVSHHSADQKLSINFSSLISYEKDHSVATDVTKYVTSAPNLPPLRKPTGELNFESNNVAFENPLAALLQLNQVKTQNTLLDMQINYRLFPSLTLTLNSGISSVITDEVVTQPAASQSPLGSPPQPMSYFGTGKYKSYIAEPQIEYTSKLGKGNLSVLIGSTWQMQNNTFESLKGTGFANDDQLLDKLAASQLATLKDQQDKYKYYGLFGRISYNRNNRYLVNITGRRDGSSRFGPSNQFGNFGAVGAGWIFSGTNFIRKNFKQLSFGKLRGSYGITGNDQIGEYRYLAYWSGTPYNYLGMPGLAPIQFAIPDYRWEECRKMEAALDLGFFKDRLTVSVAYYQNRNSNQLLSYILPATTGFTTIAARNFDAAVENSGFEFIAQAKSNGKSKLSWTSRLILTAPKNVIKSFPELAASRYPGFIVGQSLTAEKALHYTGVDPNTGLFQFEDVDKDGKISFPNDYKIMKNLDPRLYGTLDNSFTLKNWQLDVSIQGRIQTGNSYLFSIYRNAAPGTMMINQPTTVLDHWRQTGNNSSMQRISAGADPAVDAAIQNFLLSDGKYADVSYLRLRNISLRYIFSGKKLERLGMKGANIYLQAQNLYTLTAYKGYYPETQAIWSLPPLKTVVLGIDVNF